MTTKRFDAWKDYDDVDHQADPESLVAHLDVITGLESVRLYKEQTYDLLGLRPGMTVLDAGCGAGDDVIAMAERVGDSGCVIGVDSSDVMISQARERVATTGASMEFRVDDIYGLSFADASFDCSRADRVFHHLDRPEAALRELIRVTKPGGRIALFDPDFDGSIIASDDKEMTRLAIHAICDRFRNGRCGRQLYSLHKAAGLESITVVPRTFLFFDYAMVDELLGVENAVKALIEDGTISQLTGTEWLNSLRHADDNQLFSGMILGFTAVGTKPAALR